MEARLQRRIQRYGWDLAAAAYEPLWQGPLAPAHAALLAAAALRPGQRVLDVACGTGLVTLRAALAVGPDGRVLGVDIASRMVETAALRARARQVGNAGFARMEAERLALPDATFDVVLCAFGLMYVPQPEEALREMRRVLRPGGRIVVAVWGERARCGFAPLFEIVDSEVESEVCPLFFRLGQGDALARLCADAGLERIAMERITAELPHPDAHDACNAAFLGGPAALAWSRFGDAVRARVRRRYLDAIAPWRAGRGYRIPGEFVVVSAANPS